MRNRFPHHVTLSMIALTAFLHSCGKSPSQQPPTPPPDSGISDRKTQVTEDRTGQSLAKPVPPEVPPESIISPPDRDAATAGLKYDTVVTQRPASVPGNASWQYRKNRRDQIVGFEFSNRGGNRILPERHDISKDRLFTRDFQFRFDDRARQDIHLSVTDWVPSRDKQFRLSELMNSVLLFFPRKFVPAIASSGTSSIVTLPTGEKVEFSAKTHEVLRGVFVEVPVDLKAPRFPGVEYVGKGVTVRANSRGNDPRIGTVATITTGSPDPECAKGQECDQCQVPARELWEQKDAVRFKFSTDAEFDRYLRARCGFGLPLIPSAEVKQASIN